MVPVKICFVSPLAYPYFNPEVQAVSGGAELQLYTLSTALAAGGGFEVSLVSDDCGQLDGEVREGVNLYGVPTVPGSLFPFSAILKALRLRAVLGRIDFDVCVLRAWNPFNWMTASFCRAGGKKLIYMTGHDDDLLRDGTPSWLARGPKAFIQWKLFASSLEKVDLVVVQSREQEKTCQEGLGKPCVIRPSAHRGGGEPHEGGPEGDLLWMARCERWKDPEAFIRMAREMPRRKCVMVCPPAADGPFFRAVREEARGVTNLRFIESLPYRKTHEYFRRGALFVNTSRSEGFPNTFVQAARAGTPILSLRIDPDGFLEREGIGRCAGGDFEALLRLAGEMLLDEERWRLMSTRAVKYFKARHDIAKVVEDDRKMILRLLGRDGKRGDPAALE